MAARMAVMKALGTAALKVVNSVARKALSSVAEMAASKAFLLVGQTVVWWDDHLVAHWVAMSAD
jgi:hypothetical protein